MSVQINPSVSGLQKQAATPNAGYTLINGTGAILTWTAPADGNNHRVQIFCNMFVSSTETGGQINVLFTDPAGNSASQVLLNGAQAGPAEHSGIIYLVSIESGSTVTITQTSALTAGAATAWIEIWGE